MEMVFVAKEDGKKAVGVFALDDPEFFKVVVIYSDGKSKRHASRVCWFDPDDDDEKDVTGRPSLIMTQLKACLFELLGKRNNGVGLWLGKFSLNDFVDGWEEVGESVDS